MLAVLLTAPSDVLPMFSDIFMEKMAGFLKLYFPVFMLGAVFGKVIAGMEVVDRIGNVATGSHAPLKEDTPLKPVVIQKAERIAAP